MHPSKQWIAVAVAAIGFVISVASPANASTTSTSALASVRAPRADVSVVSTGLHASDVEPLVRGVAATSAQVIAYVGCFLALDDDDVCVKIADDARTTIASR